MSTGCDCDVLITSFWRERCFVTMPHCFAGQGMIATDTTLTDGIVTEDLMRDLSTITGGTTPGGTTVLAATGGVTTDSVLKMDLIGMATTPKVQGLQLWKLLVCYVNCWCTLRHAIMQIAGQRCVQLCKL